MGEIGSIIGGLIEGFTSLLGGASNLFSGIKSVYILVFYLYNLTSLSSSIAIPLAPPVNKVEHCLFLQRVWLPHRHRHCPTGFTGCSHQYVQCRCAAACRTIVVVAIIVVVVHWLAVAGVDIVVVVVVVIHWLLVRVVVSLLSDGRSAGVAFAPSSPGPTARIWLQNAKDGDHLPG